MTDERKSTLDDDEGTAFNTPEELYADMVAHGVDPDVEYVTFIEVEENKSKIMERGGLLECIKMSLKIVDTGGDVIPYVASVEAFEERVAKEVDPKKVYH